MPGSERPPAGDDAPPGRSPTNGGRSVTAPGSALHRALGERSRAAILQLLHHHPDGLPTARIAALTGLHPNTVRHHLDVLLNAGLISAREDPTRTGGRPRRLHRRVQFGDERPNGERYRLLAEIIVTSLADSHDGTARAVAAGRAWADRQRPGKAAAATPGPAGQAAAAITALFAEIGFHPELIPRGDRWQIRLHHCPFADLARAHPDIVCAVHLGLLQGALAQHHLPPEAGELTPFAEPNLCIAELPSAAA